MGIVCNCESGRVVLGNGRLELIVDIKDGLNPSGLRDIKSGRAYADASYIWPGGVLPEIKNEPVIKEAANGTIEVNMEGKLGPLTVMLAYTAPAGEPGVIYENVTIVNNTDTEIDTFDFKCGFAKKIISNGEQVKDIAAFRFCPIPYRSGTDGKFMDFPIAEATKRGMMYNVWFEPPVSSAVWGSEGWVWSDGADSFLISKYNQDAMEWSLMEGHTSDSVICLRFAGAGRWRYGNPEGAAKLAPGASFRFGETRLQVLDGDWKQAYYAYRKYTEAKGCRPPESYDPPVHWNELYDNIYFFEMIKLFPRLDWDSLDEFLEVNQKVLSETYTHDIMLIEAAKAKEIGCQTLYLDPGWDTGPDHHIWATERMGPIDEFIAKMKNEYNLNVGVWINIAGVPPTYFDPAACPPEASVVDVNGNRTKVFCFPSPAFMQTKMDRLDELCRKGVKFFLVDATQFTGPCYDRTHGHGFPSGREEHAEAIYQIISHVKRSFPDVLIEVHDRITGPANINYVPFYFQYTRPYAHDCIWGHEFMWNCLEDLRQRRGISLYYYNLASRVPFYLHINLKNDNEECLVFWWFASTIRHLGIGGKHSDPANWEAHKKAMRIYMENKRFYTQGEFYGIDECCHAHTLPDMNASVINCFNLDDAPAEKIYRFTMADIGLSGGSLEVDGKIEHEYNLNVGVWINIAGVPPTCFDAPFEISGGEITLKVTLPALGHKMFIIK